MISSKIDKKTKALKNRFFNEKSDDSNTQGCDPLFLEKCVCQNAPAQLHPWSKEIKEFFETYFHVFV